MGMGNQKDHLSHKQLYTVWYSFEKCNIIDIITVNLKYITAVNWVVVGCSLPQARAYCYSLLNPCSSCEGSTELPAENPSLVIEIVLQIVQFQFSQIVVDLQCHNLWIKYTQNKKHGLSHQFVKISVHTHILYKLYRL